VKKNQNRKESRSSKRVNRPHDLERPLREPVIALHSRCCATGDAQWTPSAVTPYLRGQGDRAALPIIRGALRLSGVEYAEDTRQWQIRPPLPIPPSPTIFDWSLKALRLPGPIDLVELIPSPQKLRLLEALSSVGRWLNRGELVALAAPGMDKNAANTLLKSLLKYRHIEVGTDKPRYPGPRRLQNVWRILQHGRRTVKLLVPRAATLDRNALPSVGAVRLMLLLQLFPHGLYREQVHQILTRCNHTVHLVSLLRDTCDQGYVETTTLGENVDFPLRASTRPFYRLTSEGIGWTHLIVELAATRFPERLPTFEASSFNDARSFWQAAIYAFCATRLVAPQH
jgi:hypothetical protein